MFKIDAHTHILPPEWPRFKERFGYGGFTCLDKTGACTANILKDDGTFFRAITANSWDPETRIKECDSANVHVQVLSTVPVMFHYWAKPRDALETSRFLNDHIASVVASHPKRFVGLATVPLQDTDLAIQELERVMSLGFRGVQIGTHINGRNLDDPALFPFFEAASRLDAAIFVHPWDMMGQERFSKYWLPWLVGMPAETCAAICAMIFGGIFERLPQLRVAFAHGGGSFPGTIGRIEHGFQVRPDLCAVDNDVNPRAYLGRFYVDSLVHDPVMLAHIVTLLGADKVILGTDYPFPLGEHPPGAMVGSMKEFDTKTKEDILGLNALRWLNLNKRAFLP